MQIKVGWYVFNENRRDWGPGEVQEVTKDKARVVFSDPVGEMTLPVRFLIRDPDDAPPPPPPSLEEETRIRMAAFFDIANLSGIEHLEDKVRRLVTGESQLWPAISTQLNNWIETNPTGRFAHASAPAAALHAHLQLNYT